ncbi:dynein regulatory complex protein 10 [Halichoeres trimaculatus]|uniref:dynein regulatory complex protein 10 n=1 Tax=Halichoeres trimaculatus TaxID=147232 RepID=UPI003D9E7635
MSRGGVRALSKTKTQPEDALQRQHKLPGKKLLPPEAQRISNILGNCISQIEFAATLPAILKSSSVPSDLDEGLSRALQKHQKMAEKLETFKGLQKESHGEQGGLDREERAQLEEDFRNSVRNLLRHCRAHPAYLNTTSDLRSEQKIELGESVSILIKEVKKFHSHMKEKLLTSVDEELAQALRKSVSSALIMSKAKEDQQAAHEKLIDGEISLHNSMIENEQRSLEKKKREEASVLIPDSLKPHTKTSKINRLQQEIDQLQTQLNSLMLENREAERAIQEKNEKIETEIQYLLQTFDTDIGEIQANLEMNEINFERELEELRKLKIPFSVLETEFNQIQEKHVLEEEKRKEEMRELELKTKAAIYAQAWWRGYSTRKALKNKGKNKKAKKGKGKKTK